MKINLDTPTEDVQIQIVPLIDVIFCILTFFILAALQLTRQQAINVDLPKASTGVPQMREMVVVTIAASGQTYVDKQLINPVQLRQILEDYHRKNPAGLMVLNASKQAFYNEVVLTLDTMRSVGGDRVALSTLPAEANQSPNQSPNQAPPLSPTAPYSSPAPIAPYSPVQPPGQSLPPTTPLPTTPGTSQSPSPLSRPQ